MSAAQPSVMMNPNRRRLSVSRCDPVAGRNIGIGPEEDVAAIVARAGLQEVFASAKKAVSITSITDDNLKNRESFADKDEEVLHPPSSAPEATLRGWLKERGIEWCCKKGKKPESPNQDSFSVLVVEDQFAIYGVFDGHGPLGHDVSDLAREFIVKSFIQDPNRAENAPQAFHDAFVATQQYLSEQKVVDASTSGTTCTLVYHEFARQTLTVAHVGDSRSVLIKKGTDLFDVEELTVDHKPNLPAERERIENSNPPGRVVFDGFYNHRVFAVGAMYPGLNMSRALGDVIAHEEAGLSAKPDLRKVDLAAERKAGYTELTLLVCTDGVWEFIGSKEAAKIALVPKAGVPVVETLAKESWNRWMQDSDNEISDDITACLIRL